MTQSSEERRLPPCPRTPNCVCSEDAGPRHIAPFRLLGEPGAALEQSSKVLEAMPRFRLIERTEDALYLEARTLICRFVDDVALRLSLDRKSLCVRSASRVGRWDLGVNRRRVERIRVALRSSGIIE
jgi:uncharacterized protein (DUF1499 family)